MGKIFYQEFVSIIFGTKTGTTRNLSPKKVHAMQFGKQGGDEILFDIIDRMRG